MTDGPERCPEAPAIDLAAGVARVMGDRGMFERVLARFREEYGGTAAAIRAALSAGDLSLAQRLAHTLKGAAGMIEAQALQQQARLVEQALRCGSGESDLQLDQLRAELDKVLREVDAVLCAGRPQAMPGDSAAPAEEVLERLRGLLDRGDGAALDLLAQTRGSLSAAMGERRFGELELAVNAFDFERALGLLGQSSGAGAQ